MSQKTSGTFHIRKDRHSGVSMASKDDFKFGEILTKPPNDSSWARQPQVTPWLDVHIGYITGFLVGLSLAWAEELDQTPGLESMQLQWVKEYKAAIWESLSHSMREAVTAAGGTVDI